MCKTRWTIEKLGNKRQTRRYFRLYRLEMHLDLHTNCTCVWRRTAAKSLYACVCCSFFSNWLEQFSTLIWISILADIYWPIKTNQNLWWSDEGSCARARVKTFSVSICVCVAVFSSPIKSNDIDDVCGLCLHTQCISSSLSVHSIRFDWLECIKMHRQNANANIKRWKKNTLIDRARGRAGWHT